MCKHILNAQVAIRAPCCKKWFDCPQCHAETATHKLVRTMEMTFACKKCKRCFRKDLAQFEEADEYCPHCDNHYVIEALTPDDGDGKKGAGGVAQDRSLSGAGRGMGAAVASGRFGSNSYDKETKEEEDENEQTRRHTLGTLGDVRMGGVDEEGILTSMRDDRMKQRNVVDTEEEMLKRLIWEDEGGEDRLG